MAAFLLTFKGFTSVRPFSFHLLPKSTTQTNLNDCLAHLRQAVNPYIQHLAFTKQKVGPLKINNMSDKIASDASYYVTGALICGGGILQWLQHLNWNTISVIVGIVGGIVTCHTNMYFKRRQIRAYETALLQGYVIPPPQEN